MVCALDKLYNLAACLHKLLVRQTICDLFDKTVVI